ncbi:hypothetical protein C7D74_33325, partial [Klebsiella pneumoniae]
TPLFKYNYRISAPPGVNGLRLNARGWFDFASAGCRPRRRRCSSITIGSARHRGSMVCASTPGAGSTSPAL